MEEYRKAQLTGKSTLIVSLPSAWAKRQRVARGSPLFISEGAEGALLISPRKNQRKKSIGVIAASTDDGVRRIISAYMAGAEDIQVSGDAAATAADKARQHLSSLEIVEEYEGRSRLKVLVKEGDVVLDDILRRMYVVCASMFQLAKNYFGSRGNGDFLAIKGRDDEIDRLYFLALRTAGGETGDAYVAMNKALLAKRLETMSDLLEQTCREPTDRAPEALAHLEMIRGVFSSCFEAYSTRKNLGKTFAEVEEASEKLRDALHSERGRKGAAPTIENLFLLCRYCKDFLEIGLNLKYHGLKTNDTEFAGPLKRQ